MSLYRVVFPTKSRTFKGMRWAKISLRTAHLVGMAGVAGNILSPLPLAFHTPYAALTIISGVLFIFIEVWSNGVWFFQLRSLAIFLKLLILSLLLLPFNLQIYLLITVIIISGFISHAPGDVRYYSIYHKRKITALKGIAPPSVNQQSS